MENIISLNNIHKGYKLGNDVVPVIKGVDIEIKIGEFVALMGSSGSGKTTLMNIFGCLDIPDRGEYFLSGKDVSRMNEDELAGVRNEHIGFVFQNFNLIQDLNVLDNVSLPSFYAGFEDIKKAKDIVNQVGLQERKKHYPNELSGGQKQRVAIARSLINDPDIILADEPTGNLDSKSGEEVMEILKKLNENGKTIILVTHDDFTASFASRKIHLKDGVIV